MEQKKLQVKNLQISFRTQAGILKAVRNITFDLYTGETLAIVANLAQVNQSLLKRLSVF